MIKTECRYCDIRNGPRDIDGNQVCNGCGAEWSNAKVETEILVDFCDDRCVCGYCDDYLE